MRKLKEFLTRHDHIKGLFVSDNGEHWNTTPSTGLTWKTREEILEGVEASASTTSEPETKKEKKTKKTKEQ